MRLRDNHRYIVRLALTASFTAFALALSYLEGIIPLGALIPLPGVKLGLANIPVILAFIYISRKGALAVSVMRVVLNFLLFGSTASFALSLGGAICSYLLLLLISYLPTLKMSYISVSVLSASAHGVGQIAVASIIFSIPEIFSYLPVLLIFGTLFGFITGILLNIAKPVCDKAAAKYLKESGEK